MPHPRIAEDVSRQRQAERQRLRRQQDRQRRQKQQQAEDETSGLRHCLAYMTQLENAHRRSSRVATTPLNTTILSRPSAAVSPPGGDEHRVVLPPRQPKRRRQQGRQDNEQQPARLSSSSTVHSILQGLVGKASVHVESTRVGTGSSRTQHQLREHPGMTSCAAQFHSSMADFRHTNWFYCPFCKERGFDTQPANKTTRTECLGCYKSRRANNGVRVFSAENEGDPFPVDLPRALPTLTTIEEILIARTHVAFTCYRLPGGVLGYRGSVVNLQKDTFKILNQLPLRVNQLPVVLIVKFGTPTNPEGGDKEFRVRREAVLDYLLFLKANNPLYHDINIDNGALHHLPLDGSVINQLQVVVEEEEEEQRPPLAPPIAAPLSSSGSSSSATSPPLVTTTPPGCEGLLERRVHVLEVDGDSNEQLNGPDQCGATGQEIGETGNFERDYVGQPVSLEHQHYEQQQGILISEQIERHLIVVPPAGAPINDYNTPNLQALAFPTLFPFGVGDFTNRDRLVDVCLSKSAKHLLSYVLRVHCEEEDGTSSRRSNPAGGASPTFTYLYPFAQHERWMYWMQNTVERHRFQQQKRVCLDKLPNQVTSMNIDELNSFIARGDLEGVRAITGNMQMFSANILGSDAYFSKKRRELESLMQQKGMPTMWFTLSAADNHWPDLHELAGPGGGPATATGEQEKAAWRRSWVRRNPHIVDSYFQERAKCFLETYLGDTGLQSEWVWYRVEYQKRGCAHIHGCCRLRSDPNLHQLSQNVLHGREAQLQLRASGIIPPAMTTAAATTNLCLFTPEDTADDRFVRGFDNRPLSNTEVEDLYLKINQGLEDQEKIIKYHDFLISTTHPSPPLDATLDSRDEATRFQQTAQNFHPCTVLPENFDDLHYARLYNACQRHKCCAYCQRQDSEGNTFCRNEFPKNLRSNTAIAVKQKRMRNGGIHTTIEMIPKRNDKWLNSNCPPLFCNWQANIDVRLTIDVGKIVSYMTKYITKTECTYSASTRRHFSAMLRQAAFDQSDTVQVLKRFMTRLHGERTRSQQETCHLLYSLPLVYSDHSFITINLKNNTAVLESEDCAGQVSTSLSVIDGYAQRLRPEAWGGTRHGNESESHHHLCHGQLENLQNMSVNDFCQKYTVGKKGRNKNKIITLPKPAKKVAVVARFYPCFPSSPNSPLYPEYCKLQLVRFRPWSADYNSAFGGEDATREEIVHHWESFLISLADHGGGAGGRAGSLTVLFQGEIERIKEQLASNNDNLSSASDVVLNGAGDDDSEEAAVGGAHTGRSIVELEYSNLGVDSGGLCWADEDDVAEIAWDEGRDWSVMATDLSTSVMYHDPVKELETWRLHNDNLPEAFHGTIRTTTISRAQLNFRQQQFMLIIDQLLDANTVSSTDGGNGPSRCLILRGRGGSGKSFCMRCVQTERGFHQVKALATTGKAASVLFHGSTVYNRTNGLALPVGRQIYSKLQGHRLRELQERWKEVRVVFIDEMTMLHQKHLLYIDQRLQEIKGTNRIFGGIIVILVGDTAQLPPVGGLPLWNRTQAKARDDTQQGMNLYFQQFTTVIRLTENNRLVEDPDMVLFNDFLNRLADGKCTQDDWQVARARSHSTIGPSEWEKRGFNDDGVIHLYATNKQVEKHNLEVLKGKNKPILRIDAMNSSARARAMSSDRFMGLQNTMFFSIDSTVVLTWNLWPEMGLSNGSTGVVKEIEFRSLRVNIHDQPYCVWVDFSTQYIGPPFFNESERRGWVPIASTSASEYTKKANSLDETTHTRTMVPLKLAWAWTIWKVQGQTINGKVVVDLGAKEMEHGLSYVAFSRVRRFKDIGIMGGIPLQRITSQISNQEKLKNRIFEDVRLEELEKQTLLALHQQDLPLASEQEHNF
jgi:Helitron helicase-like domain at N-terminus/PIF1-like helicase